MEKRIFIISILVMFMLFGQLFALANPSAVYCNELSSLYGDYEYILQFDENNNQYGVCFLPDGTSCEGWDFLKGKCGEEYSYCEQIGKSVKTLRENGSEYAVCVEDGEPAKLGTALEEEMGLSELLGAGIAHDELEKKSGLQTALRYEDVRELGVSIYNASDYAEWDWRSPPNGTVYSASNYLYFDTPLGWTTSVKNQAYCGSCWAFSALGAMEAKYNIEQNESRLNPDLSEQHEVSCDNINNNGCNGGNMNQAYDYIIEEGVLDEACFSYQAIDSYGCDAGSCNETPVLCSDRCADYGDRLWTIEGYFSRNSAENPAEINVSNEELKQMLIDHGPLAIAVNANGWSPYSSGIFTCAGQSYWNDLNHGVVLVGYNDTGNIDTSYWIVKNSWGSGWGLSGYIHVRFNCSGIGTSVEYPYHVTPPDFAPTVELVSPENETATSTLDSVLFSFITNHQNSTSSICSLFIEDSIKNSTSVENSTETNLETILEFGTYLWNIRCWEEGLGIIGVSDNRTIENIHPTINILSPLNITYNKTTIDLNYTLIGEGNCSYSLDGGVNQTLNDCENITLVNITEGKHILITYFEYLTNNISSTNVYFTVDLTAPNIFLILPENESLLSDKNVTFSFNATDNIVENITCFININGTIQELFVENETIKEYEIILDDGYYEWNVSCSDNIHLEVSPTLIFTLVESSINILSPLNITYNKTTIDLNYTLIGEGNCSYSLDGGVNQTLNDCENITLVNVTEGIHELSVYFNDSNEHIRTDNIFFTVDLTAPEIELIAPLNRSTSTSKQITFSFIVQDNLVNEIECELNINGDINIIQVENNTQKEYQETFSNGVYVWNITCNDGLNLGFSETWEFNVNYQTRGGGSGGGSGGGAPVAKTQEDSEEISNVDNTSIDSDYQYGEKEIEFKYNHTTEVNETVKLFVGLPDGTPAAGIQVEVIDPFGKIIILVSDEYGFIDFIPENEGIYKIKLEGETVYVGSIQVFSMDEETPIESFVQLNEILMNEVQEEENKFGVYIIMGIIVILVSAGIMYIYSLKKR